MEKVFVLCARGGYVVRGRTNTGNLQQCPNVETVYQHVSVYRYCISRVCVYKLRQCQCVEILHQQCQRLEIVRQQCQRLELQ